MTYSDLQSLLSRFSESSILVVGDYFLDRYLEIDPSLAEKSIETGLEARQVVSIRNSPGAAGTITSNLVALGVGKVRALGAIGNDGQGYDLLNALRETGVETDGLISMPDRFTPTYTKPMSANRELERLDIKNRDPTPSQIEDQLLESLRTALPEVDGVIVQDQVQERNCGVITDRVREELSGLAGRSNKTIFADSRTRISEFRNVILKPNREEALRAQGTIGDVADDDSLRECARNYANRTGRPVFMTLGPAGILVANGDEVHHVPGIEVPDPIDIVGAGDSVSAGVVASLCSGASLSEAALVGVLASSITIQQIGTTGTASPEQVLTRFGEVYPNGFEA